MKFDKKTLERWERSASDFLACYGMEREEVTTGQDAWGVAHRTGIYREAIAMDASVVDAHVQTALERIFPNATFKDPKRY